MSLARESDVAIYLRHHPVPHMGDPVRAVPLEPGRNVTRWRVEYPQGSVILKSYRDSALQLARSEVAGLTLMGTLGLAPTLISMEQPPELAGSVVLIQEDVAGEPLSSRITEESVLSWQTVLLTLHHLPPPPKTPESPTCSGVLPWWERTRRLWAECRGRYTAPAMRPLMEALAQLEAIVGVRVEVNRHLWLGASRRACHGQADPSKIVFTQQRLMLTDWTAFGVGDPAMDVTIATMRPALSGMLDEHLLNVFLDGYTWGMRDLGDEGLSQRIGILSSVMPFASAIEALAEGMDADPAERARTIFIVRRALDRVSRSLSVAIGSVEELVAPLSQR